MPAQFKSKIEVNEDSTWQIRIIDELENEQFICHSVDEYAKQIEIMGEPYASDIVVKWEKDKNLSLEQFNEIEKQMKKYQDEIEQNKDV